MAFTIKSFDEMKLSVLIFTVAWAKKTPSLWLKKETDVQQAYFNNEEIILQDPKERARRPWDACGDKPPVPANAVSVECDGQFCAAICPIGWRSEKIWRIACITQGYEKWSKNWWSHDAFSPCITCSEGMAEEFDKKAFNKRFAVFHSTSTKRNLPTISFSCGKFQSGIMPFKGWKSGSVNDKAYRQNNHKIQCQCKANEHGIKTCNWMWRENPSWLEKVKTVWKTEYIDTIDCWDNWKAYPCSRLPCNNA